MKKLFALLTILPFVALADMPGKTIYQHEISLHRIGYEIFPEFGPGIPLCDRLSADFQALSMTHMLIVILSLFLGFFLIVALRHKNCRKVQVRMDHIIGVTMILAAVIAAWTYFVPPVLNLWKNNPKYRQDEQDRVVKVVHGIRGPVWNENGDLFALKARAEDVMGDLQKEINALMLRLKLDALNRFKITLLEDVPNEVSAKMVDFPDTLEDVLIGVIVDCYNAKRERSNNPCFLRKWGSEPGLRDCKFAKKHFTWEMTGGRGEISRALSDFVSGMRWWRDHVGESIIPKKWLPKGVKSDLDLIRTCLAESKDLRQRCLGIPVEYFGALDFDICRGDVGAFDEWVAKRVKEKEAAMRSLGMSDCNL